MEFEGSFGQRKLKQHGIAQRDQPVGERNNANYTGKPEKLA